MSDLTFGLRLTVAGMSTVFGLLVLLMLVLLLIGRLDRPPKPMAQPRSEQEPALELATDPELQLDTEERTPPQLAPSKLGGAQPALTITDPSGFTTEELHAIACAVLTHSTVLRNEAAAVMRTHAPGSLLHTSRWVALGRGLQNNRRQGR